MIRFLLNTAVSIGLLGHERIIRDRTGTHPYLSRFYLRGRPYMADGTSPYNESGNPKPEAIFPDGIGVYIHRFHRSDEDEALHSHPWPWAISLILAGGYREERRNSVASDEDGTWREKFVVDEVVYRPGDINVLTDDSFHRVDLLEEDAWSLFIVAPARRHREKKRSWSFWNRETLAMVPWRKFLASIRSTDESLA